MAEVVFGKASEVENEKVVVKRFGRKRVAVCKFENNYYAFKDVLSSTVGSEAWNSRDLKSRPH